MLGINTLLHITSALALAMLYKQYQDIRLLLETRDDMEKLSPPLGDITYLRDDAEAFVAEVTSGGSSVQCTGHADHTQRLCRFHNLCYMPSSGHFVFFHSVASVVEGVPSDRFSPALLDLSSVANHNTLYFSYVDVPASEAETLLHNVEVIHTPSLLFRRFNPSNIMHVFHDDLLPLYHTLRLITLGRPPVAREKFPVQLVLLDDAEPGSFYELYELLSSRPPITKLEMTDNGRPVCFKDAHVGVSKATTWYQYGFFTPQGPIPNATASALHVTNFAKYLKKQLRIDQNDLPREDSDPPHDQSNGKTSLAVVFTRKHNRVIVNEVDLTVALAHRLQMKVMTLSLETHSVSEIIRILGTASLLIGMHGSLLVLSMFLSPGALLVELFPYAVSPDNYTPYKTLASLPGTWLRYRSWRNTDPSRTLTHPHRSWELGGIAHLPQQEQDRITQSTQVPTHLCCRNPEWLFRIYQDTHVDIDAVIAIIEQHLEDSKVKIPDSASLVQQRLIPSAVADISCAAPASETGALSLTFSAPVNLPYLSYSTVQYEVWLQEAGREAISAWILSRTQHHFSTGLQHDTVYLVWVRCILDGQLQGPFSTDPVRCHTS